MKLETEGGLLPTQKVLVDYDKLPMRCKACHSWKHRVRDCKEIKKKGVRGGRRPIHTYPQHQHEKGKNIVVDEDGFQHVRHRKNARRNIFDIVNDDRRSIAFTLGEEARAGHYRAQQMELGHTSGGQEERRSEGGEGIQLQGQPRAMEAQNKVGGPRNVTSPPKEALESEGPKEMEMDVSTRKSGDETLSLLTRKNPGLCGSAEKGKDATYTEGRGDPTSTMLWSPRKHASQKRPLESEEEEFDRESMTDEEAAHEGNQNTEALDAEGGNQQHSVDPQRRAEETNSELGEERRNVGAAAMDLDEDGRRQGATASEAGGEVSTTARQQGKYVEMEPVHAYRHSSRRLRQCTGRR